MLQVFSPQILAALDLFSVRSVRENANSNASSNIFYRVDFVLSDVIIYSESYRSGHNEVVLKTICRKRRVGSNPTLSGNKKGRIAPFFVSGERE